MFALLLYDYMNIWEVCWAYTRRACVHPTIKEFGGESIILEDEYIDKMLMVQRIASANIQCLRVLEISYSALWGNASFILDSLPVDCLSSHPQVGLLHSLVVEWWFS